MSMHERLVTATGADLSDQIGRRPDHALRAPAPFSDDRFTPYLGDRRGAERPPDAPRFWWHTPELEHLGIVEWLDTQYGHGRQLISAKQDDSGHWTLYACRSEGGGPEARKQTSPWVLGPMVRHWPPNHGLRPRDNWEDRGYLRGWLVAKFAIPAVPRPAP